MSEKTFSNEDFAVEDENSELQAIAARLKFAIENAGGNKAVSERASVPLSTLNGYIAGRDMKGSAAAKLAQACDVSLEWLYFGDARAQLSAKNAVMHAAPEKLPEFSTPTANDRVSIRLFNVEASAGYGITGPNVEEQASVDLIRSSLPNYVVSRLPHLVAVTVRGDSMTPSLYDGDIIFVDTKDTDVIPGCMYVLRRDNDIMVKRLTWTTLGDLVVSSDNPRFPAETVEAKRARALFEDGGFPVQVVGRVLWRTGIVGSL
ncbi:LexA family transcriptional regulator [Gluconobacter sp.]|uniref:LexA family transcriptional regulator n=1 Tax=Gluconobacter sp. TaxID=1876758 RepID=UPI0039E77711